MHLPDFNSQPRPVLHQLGFNWMGSIFI